MNLEIGMYVRTDWGICKIENIIPYKTKDKFKIYIDKHSPSLSYIISEECIKKASHNIVDLIEEGDLVKIEGIWKEVTDVTIPEHDCDRLEGYAYVNYDDCYKIFSDYIKSIITHEQIEQNQYIVEGVEEWV